MQWPPVSLSKESRSNGVVLCQLWIDWGKPLNKIGFTDFPAYSDTLGTREKCHFKRGVTVTTAFFTCESLIGNCLNCHCNRGVTVTSVIVSGEVCTKKEYCLSACLSGVRLLSVIDADRPRNVPTCHCQLKMRWTTKRRTRLVADFYLLSTNWLTLWVSVPPSLS